jgi:hypothetical protein
LIKGKEANALRIRSRPQSCSKSRDNAPAGQFRSHCNYRYTKPSRPYCSLWGQASNLTQRLAQQLPMQREHRQERYATQRKNHGQVLESPRRL